MFQDSLLSVIFPKAAVAAGAFYRYSSSATCAADVPGDSCKPALRCQGWVGGHGVCVCVCVCVCDTIEEGAGGWRRWPRARGACGGVTVAGAGAGGSIPHTHANTHAHTHTCTHARACRDTATLRVRARLWWRAHVCNQGFVAVRAHATRLAERGVRGCPIFAAAGLAADCKMGCTEAAACGKEYVESCRPQPRCRRGVHSGGFHKPCGPRAARTWCRAMLPRPIDCLCALTHAVLALGTRTRPPTTPSATIHTRPKATRARTTTS